MHIIVVPATERSGHGADRVAGDCLCRTISTQAVMHAAESEGTGSLTLLTIEPALVSRCAACTARTARRLLRTGRRSGNEGGSSVCRGNSAVRLAGNESHRPF
jgi:bacterioferritin-associated ferredoxin